MTIRKDVIAVLSVEPRSVPAIARDLAMTRGDADRLELHPILVLALIANLAIVVYLFRRNEVFE
jgi:hypothetical protein